MFFNLVDTLVPAKLVAINNHNGEYTMLPIIIKHTVELQPKKSNIIKQKTVEKTKMNKKSNMTWMFGWWDAELFACRQVLFLPYAYSTTTGGTRHFAIYCAISSPGAVDHFLFD